MILTALVLIEMMALAAVSIESVSAALNTTIGSNATRTAALDADAVKPCPVETGSACENPASGAGHSDDRDPPAFVVRCPKRLTCRLDHCHRTCSEALSRDRQVLPDGWFARSLAVPAGIC